MKEQLKISDHFSFLRILRITLAPILMMVFSSLYSVVDGFFISNYAGNRHSRPSTSSSPSS